MRENVFTQFARAINDLADHRIDKVRLYEMFCSMIEIADANEKSDRKNFIETMEKRGTMDLMELSKSEKLYSNYEAGLNILYERKGQ